MELSIRRVKALIKKEIKDFIRNKNVSIICLLPVVYALIAVNAGKLGNVMPKIDMLNMGLSMNLTLVSTFSISMLIAEEKEKNTNRTLILSSVSPVEFLLGKAIWIILFSVITNIIMYLIIGIDIQYIGYYILWSTLVVLTMVQIGGVIGLISHNQMSTGVVGIPVLIVFLIIPLLASLNDTLKRIALLLPNYSVQVVLDSLINGKGYNSFTYNILVILVWILIAAIVLAYTYNKTGLDK
ncbi:ABC transporter permease [Clostridium sp. D2Q-11]|uniref:ABC transporter permease n=1 Tax=Anaeromonas frigoriresistens TaxID=2683708 RepID=A0A942Z6Y6_9FIRM|nr:ABC transporter permease [Anaeromonas frigoriresistens]MBS4538971.1 ABC transporter permease [Anaeromonas frigoriresistens]